MGIQERETHHMMNGPIIYNIVNQSVIARTCITQLKQEVFVEATFGKRHLKPDVRIVKKNTKDPFKNAQGAKAQI